MAEPAAAGGAGRLARGAPWLLVAAVAAAFATAFLGTFQFDDFPAVVRDPRVQSLGAWARSMPGIRPLLKLTYALNHASGLGLPGFHAVNVAIHAVNGALALALLRRVAAATGPHPPAAPLLGALLFALHPVQVESVTYVSGRSASLAGGLALASALAWLRAGEGPGGRAWRAASAALFALALAAKEYVAVLPAALLLLAASDPGRPGGWRGALRRTAPHLAVLAAAALLVLASPTYRRLLGAGLDLRGPWENALTQVQAVAWLAGQLVRLDRLVADPALPAVTALGPAVALQGLALLAALAAGLLLLRRRPAVAFGVLWFLLWAAPTGWIAPRADPANERHLYLALLGPAWLLGRWLAAGGRARLAAAAGLVVALGAATAARSLVYRDEVAYWADVARKVPGNARAWNNLGHALAVACRPAEAEAAFRRALLADPGHYRAAVNLHLLRAGEPLGPDGEGRCPPPRP